MSFAIRLVFILVVLFPSCEAFAGDHDGTNQGDQPESVLIIRDARMKMFFLRVYEDRFVLQEIDEKSGEQLARVEGARDHRISSILEEILGQRGFSKGVWVKEIETDPNEFEESCLVALAIGARGGYVIRYLKDRGSRRALFSRVRALLHVVLERFSPVCVGLYYGVLRKK